MCEDFKSLLSKKEIEVWNYIKRSHLETGLHSLRVSLFSYIFLQIHNVNKNKISKIVNSALIHDIGKTYAKVHPILDKKGDLTENEYSNIKNHTTEGYNILKNKFPQLENQLNLSIITQHHERWDGSGYPKGLKQNEINKYAHMVGLMDAFEAACFGRSYQTFKANIDVYTEFLDLFGKHFDPNLKPSFKEFYKWYNSNEERISKNLFSSLVKVSN